MKVLTNNSLREVVAKIKDGTLISSKAKEAEQSRVEAEQSRVEAEQSRVEAEQSRVEAESTRKESFASLKTDSEAATLRANKAADAAYDAIGKYNAPKETLSISISCNHDEELKGKKVYIKNSADNSTLVTLVWNGEPLSYSLTPRANYYIECEAIDGYSVPKSDTFTSVSGNVREVSLEYQSEWFYPTINNADGTPYKGSFEIFFDKNNSSRTEYTYKEDMCVKLPFGAEYQLVPKDNDGYYAPILVSRIASEAEYHVTVEYKPIGSGIGIQMIDGTIVKAEDWDDAKYSKDDVNGIAVSTTAVKCVIYPAVPASKPWGADGLVDGCDNQGSMYNIKGSLGAQNTAAIVKALGESDDYAAGYCYNKVMKSGRRCYLPALDELRILYANRDAINACTQKIIGKNIITYYWMWSSTQSGASGAWGFDSSAGSAGRGSSGQCIPVSAL